MLRLQATFTNVGERFAKCNLCFVGELLSLPSPLSLHLHLWSAREGFVMSTGQTLFTIFSFILLITLLVGFYEKNANVAEDMTANRDRIMAVSIAKSYSEMAQGLEFDDVSMRSDTALRTPSVLTPVALLGKEGSDGTGIDDFDDLNGFKGEEVMPDSSAIYNVDCHVYYLEPGKSDVPSSSPTFLKRMDIKVWRADAAAMQKGEIDTVRMFTIAAYFRPTEGIVRPDAPPGEPPPPPLPPELRPHPIPRVTAPRPARPATRPIPRASTTDS